MFSRLTAIPNRSLLYDVYQYTWDAKEATMLLDSYIAWLGMILRAHTACTLNRYFLVNTEAGGSEVNPEHEPFVPRGGFVAEMQVHCNVHECVVRWAGHTIRTPLDSPVFRVSLRNYIACSGQPVQVCADKKHGYAFLIL